MGSTLPPPHARPVVRTKTDPPFRPSTGWTQGNGPVSEGDVPCPRVLRLEWCRPEGSGGTWTYPFRTEFGPREGSVGTV